MPIQLLSSKTDLDRYNAWIQDSGQGNLWQSLERKAYLEALGKEVRIYASQDDGQIRASALVMIDRTIGGYSVWEIPRGPVGPLKVESGKRLPKAVPLGKEEKVVVALLKQIIDDAKKDKCLALYLTPPNQEFFIHFPLSTFRSSRRLVHCEATRIIDLTQSEEEILSQMKQKGRYNIKVAKKNDISIKESRDVDAFYDLVKKTGKRDGFVSLPKKTYQAFLDHLPGAFLLLAYVNQTEPIAGVLSVVWGERVTYYYGASNHAERAKMAPYLLQWESIRYAKVRGCSEYDLLGVSPQASNKRIVDSGKSFIRYPLFPKGLPSVAVFHSGRRTAHPWSGISSFKEKFGGEVVMYPKEKMIVLKPFVYRLLQMKRKLLG